MHTRCGWPAMPCVIARRVFEIGQVVLSYGGKLAWHDGTHPFYGPRTHCRNLPGNGWYLDGKESSSLLCCGPLSRTDPDQTTHSRMIPGYTTLPDHDPAMSSSADCKRCQTGLPENAAIRRRMLDFTGIGFMVNAKSSRCRRFPTNVKPSGATIKPGLISGVPYPVYSFYIATRRIAIGDEVIGSYVKSKGNPEYEFECMDSSHY